MHTELAARYERDGYYFPIEAFSTEDTCAHRRALEALEAHFGEGAEERAALRGFGNLFAPFVDDITRNGTILDAVEPVS